ncbi:collagen alpha-1(XIV) chain-like [Leucoraja erinacea]|uniref:collagen alpha-1(XIV) chain-like n=1 Tax=Leucoraja erinaceus TaxID=7782 RepID=UPI0024566D1B|nr:collagen alpha-1(XIV) chain-like [Leucoraja erinacea]
MVVYTAEALLRKCKCNPIVNPHYYRNCGCQLMWEKLLSRIIAFSVLACTESSMADIVFLVDGSWSIGTQNFEKIQDFLYTLVDGFDVGEDKVRIGLIQYSDNPHTEFFLNTFRDKNEILQKIQQLPYKGGGTRTGLGLKLMLNMLFVASAGSRALMGVPQVAIVITDGQSQDNVELPAKALKEQGIIVYAIGIREAKEEELKEIASQPASDYVYNVADFNALSEISQAVIRVVCTRVEEVSREVSKVTKSSLGIVSRKPRRLELKDRPFCFSSGS